MRNKMLKTVLVLAVLMGGCSQTTNVWCKADLVVGGQEKHLGDEALCGEFLFANGTFNVQMTSAPDSFFFTTPNQDSDFATSPGNGGFMWNGDTKYGGGTWVKSVHEDSDWEMVFTSEDGTLSGSAYGHFPRPTS